MYYRNFLKHINQKEKEFISYLIQFKYFNRFNLSSDDQCMDCYNLVEKQFLDGKKNISQERMSEIKRLLFDDTIFCTRFKFSPEIQYKWYKLYEARFHSTDIPEPEVCAQFFNNEFTTIYDKLNILYYSLVTHFNEKPSKPLPKNISYEQIDKTISTIWNKIKPNVLTYLKGYGPYTENYEAFRKLIRLSAIYNPAVKLNYMVKLPMYPQIKDMQDRLDYLKKLGTTIPALPEIIKQDNELLKKLDKLNNNMKKMEQQYSDIRDKRLFVCDKVLDNAKSL